MAVRVLGLLLLVALAAGGCDTGSPADSGTVGAPRVGGAGGGLPSQRLPVPSAASGTSLRPTPGGPAASAIATASYPTATAVTCAGSPTAGQILALLQARGVITAGQGSVTTGPLCSGAWQYAVVTSSGREPLQVVTSLDSGTLALITAGTDVCTPAVITQAPQGIRLIAHC